MSRKVHIFRKPGNENRQLVIDTANLGTRTGTSKRGKTPGRSCAVKNNNKSQLHKQPASLTNETDEYSTGFSKDDGIIPMPQTPVLEKETLPVASEDMTILDLDQCVEDDDKEQMDLVIPCPCRETAEGNREGLVLNSSEEKESQLVSCGDEKESEMLGPCRWFDGEMLLFDDIIQNELLDDEGALNEGREDDFSLISLEGEKKITGRNEDHGKQIVETGNPNNSRDELYRSSSIGSCSDEWSWENLVQWDENVDNMVTCFWEGDNLGEGENQKLQEMDNAKQNAFVAWLLS